MPNNASSIPTRPHHFARPLSNREAGAPLAISIRRTSSRGTSQRISGCPFDSCAVLTLDGRGQRATTSYGQFSGRGFRRLLQIDVPDSLGLLYEAVTSYLGFLHSSDEYKVMALALIRRPRPSWMSFATLFAWKAKAATRREICARKRFGPARQRNAELLQRHFDIARARYRKFWRSGSSSWRAGSEPRPKRTQSQWPVASLSIA